MNIIFLPILVPAIAGALTFALKKFKGVKEGIACMALLINLILAIMLYRQEISVSVPWANFGFDLSFRLYNFSSFIMLSAAVLSFLVCIYSIAFMWKKESLNQFYGYFLINVAFANGVVLSDNLVAMLFFWEGLLLTTFGFIFIGHKDAYKTAVKAFIILATADICLMFGVAIAGHEAGTLSMQKINLELQGLGAIAFIFMMIGAIAKGGSMPFHSWIPDAAGDAPLPFMALVPAAFEKLIGIYFLSRITLDLFKFTPSSWLSTLLMIIGGATLILAVMMALVQTEFKRLLSYHAISQVGYMILGIGTGTPAGIVGGIFHMINNALYKCCLFLTGGAVEKQVGTTNLKKLGGIFRKMPITFACYVIAAAAISGVPPFNGFFSKELIYDGALERGWIFYAIALVGSFFTAASFLKLGHSAFVDKPSEGDGEKLVKDVKEAPVSMLVPMIVIALICILFGVYNVLPIRDMIQPILGEHRLEGHDYAGFPKSLGLVVLSIIVLIGAYINHRYGFKKTGKAVGAVDHIHYAPILGSIYEKAEKRYFDPYEIGLKVMHYISHAANYIDKAVAWISDVLIVRISFTLSEWIREFHNGNYSYYIVWSIVGTIVVVIFFMLSVKPL